MNWAQNRKHNKIFIKEQQYASSKTIFQGKLVMVIFFFFIIVWLENRKLTNLYSNF